MIRIITIFFAGFCAIAGWMTVGLAGAAQAQQAAQIVRAAVLRVDPPRLPPISRLDARPDDLGFAGAQLAIQDNDTTGRFMGQDFEAIELATPPKPPRPRWKSCWGRAFPSSSFWPMTPRPWLWPIRRASGR